MTRRLTLAGTATLAIVLAGHPAWCRDTAPEALVGEHGYTYAFKDDLVAGGGPEATAPRLHVVQHAARSVLIRPRGAFITELLKTVEDL